MFYTIALCEENTQIEVNVSLHCSLKLNKTVILKFLKNSNFLAWIIPLNEQAMHSKCFV